MQIFWLSIFHFATLAGSSEGKKQQEEQKTPPKPSKNSKNKVNPLRSSIPNPDGAECVT